MALAAFPQAREIPREQLDSQIDRIVEENAMDIVPDRREFVEVCTSEQYWAGQAELITAAKHFKLNIWVFDRQLESKFFHHCPSVEIDMSNPHCFLVHTDGGVHYNVIARKPKGNRNGPKQYVFKTEEVPVLVQHVFFHR
jgi:hypothetical protein